jgi:tRNA pseudouridine13 synthase
VLYLLKRRRAFPVLPIVGRDTKPSMLDAMAQAVLDAAGVSPGSFVIAQIPELTSAGRWREALLPVTPAIAPGEKLARSRFFLPKGSYATTVLREYMKADPICMA